MHKSFFRMEFLSFCALVATIVFGGEPLWAQAPAQGGGANNAGGQSGGLNLPTQQEWIEGFGRMGVEALGVARDLRSGWQRGSYWQRGRGWRYGPMDRGWRRVGRDRWGYDWPEDYY
ncbi:MAG: hypothetical protein JXM70_23790, partial [Pirellulales bacterium]|nr:hypothetical protein [Pirellulales bacterium]